MAASHVGKDGRLQSDLPWFQFQLHQFQGAWTSECLLTSLSQFLHLLREKNENEVLLQRSNEMAKVLWKLHCQLCQLHCQLHSVKLERLPSYPTKGGEDGKRYVLTSHSCLVHILGNLNFSWYSNLLVLSAICCSLRDKNGVPCGNRKFWQQPSPTIFMRRNFQTRLILLVPRAIMKLIFFILSGLCLFVLFHSVAPSLIQ